MPSPETVVARASRRAASTVVSTSCSRIALERVRPDVTGTFDDTDTATRKTVEKMCELIKSSCTDELVQRCAQKAKQSFAMGSNDPAALAWGVFWFVKHTVRFRLDEGTMYLIGDRDQQDLLIAPAVLLRMKDPAEDCDGFTMLTAALLTCLGVPVLIATVATEADDPSRWSHVFLCAIINGRVMPLDTSHGPAPGWMVPKHRIHRWQTWKLDGTPADVKIPSYQGLHGYSAARRGGLGQVRVGGRVVMMPRLLIAKRGRGFGQACASSEYDYDTGAWDDSSCSSSIDLTGGATLNPFSFVGPTGADASSAMAAGMCVDAATGGSVQCGAGTSPGTVVPSTVCGPGYTLTTGSGQVSCTNNSIIKAAGGGTIPAGSSVSPNWGALAGQIVATVGQDAKAVIQQPQALLNAQTWANLTAYLPIIGIAVLGVVVLTSVAGKK